MSFQFERKTRPAIIRHAIFVSLAAISLITTQAAAQDAPVTLTVHGHRAVMDNGILNVTVDEPSATITSIRYHDHGMVSEGGRHRSIYFSRDGGADYEQLAHCIGSIVAQTPDMAEVSCRHVYTPAAGDKHAWDVDVHFVLRRGVSGVYVYAVNSHPADYPEVSVGEWRMVWSTPEEPRDWLPRIYVDSVRHWLAPTPAEMSAAQAIPGAPKEVTEITSGPWAGKYDCKYEYAAQYWDLGCWGFASDQSGLGAWVVFGSHEFFNDGPNKQDLTAAVGTTLVHLNMNHYDGTSFKIPQGHEWRKFYGPWLLYFNDKGSGDACWHDAQEQAKSEAKSWPYAWVKSSDYPTAAQRGIVQGRLVVHDSLKPNLTAAGAWVGLAEPENGPNSDFQFQAKAYQFWVHADADGSFVLPAVRPGQYELYAFVTGAVGQFTRTGITVEPGGTVQLGDLTWNVPHNGTKLAWEIGVPDRSAAEFGHGRDYYLPLLYKTLWKEVPEPLDFTIGQSDAKHGWYYAQSRHGAEDHPEPEHWRIHFQLNAIPAGDATLTLAFAGADRARLSVFVNDDSKALVEVIPTVQGGNGLIREAVHTKYSVSFVSIPAQVLHQGANTLMLVQDSVRLDSSYIMYDYLSLELP